ncbi:MAG TPA: type II secretion system F family protein [Planctomycetaceae bacterium]|nr:type II secretion system F family protein [Planctomycetaceae bacterium]
MTPELIPIAAFFTVTTMAGLGLLWFSNRDRELSQRLDDLRDPRGLATRGRMLRARQNAQATLFATLSSFGSRLLPGSDAARVRLVERFMNAGIYSPAGPSLFATVRFAAGLALPVAVMIAAQFGVCERQIGLLVAAALALAGFVGANLWLNSRVADRKRKLRRSLPDFLDLMGTCVQAGQSFEAALARVTDELRAAHPVLAFELMIVQREMTLGSPAARAIRGFAARSGLDVIRQLSTLVDQSRRFGSSMTDSLRVHAEMLRMQRSQQAEMLAHKAGVKILLPTLLFIFPPVLVILAGPAAIDLHEKLVVQSAKPDRK